MPGLRWTDEEYAAYLARQGAQQAQEDTRAPRQGKETGQQATALLEAPRSLPDALDRYQSKTERRWAEEIAEPLKHEGKIKDWWYSPCKGLYLAAKTSYTPDFLVWNAQGALIFVEVKGALIRPKDWEKTKFAARIYGCFVFELWQWKSGHWRCKQVPNG